MPFSTTIGGLLERVKRDATLGVYGPIYTLTDPLGSSDTSLTISESPEHITVGSTLAISTELLRVTAVSGQTVTVVRGQGGTTAVTASAGDVVEVDPRLPLASLIDWARHELLSWRKQIFRVSAIDIAVSRAERTYLFTPTESTETGFLLDVRQQPNGSTATWDDWNRTWTGDTWPRVEAKLLRQLPGSEFAGGYALQLQNYPRFSTDLRVIYGTDFDLSAFELTDDLIADVGMEEGQLDVLENGIRWRALQAGIVPRTDWRASGVLRDSEQVSLLDVVRAVDMARSLRDRRFADEALILRSRWPYRRGG